jgi:hypothetical protein
LQMGLFCVYNGFYSTAKDEVKGGNSASESKIINRTPPRALQRRVVRLENRKIATGRLHVGSDHS